MVSRDVPPPAVELHKDDPPNASHVSVPKLRARDDLILAEMVVICCRTGDLLQLRVKMGDRLGRCQWNTGRCNGGGHPLRLFGCCRPLRLSVAFGRLCRSLLLLLDAALRELCTHLREGVQDREAIERSDVARGCLS